MNSKKYFWPKVAGVGLVAGLLGGGVVVGGQNWYQNHQQGVPVASSKNGGTRVNSSKASGQNQTTKAYAQVKGAVVSVLNQQNVADNGSILAQLYGLPQSGSGNSLQTASEGSGVIYQKKDGQAYIVTNNHVVKGAKQLQVILANHKKVKATLVGADAATDLAVLKIDDSHVSTVASFANSNDLITGQNVLAIGSPMGSEYANTVTKGIVSAKDRTIKAGTDGTLTKVIQTDAAINSGNSGGPLINEAGQIVGINSMKLGSGNSGATVEGMGFAIPSNEVVSVINQLVKNGKISRPSLGIQMVALSQIAQSSRESVLKVKDSTTGVVVMKVLDNSAASQAGLKKYDVITRINNHQIDSPASIKAALYKYKVGDIVRITYLRSGKQQVTTVHLTQEASQDVQNSGISNGDE